MNYLYYLYCKIKCCFFKEVWQRVGYEQQIFAKKEKTKAPPNLKQKVFLRNIKDLCWGTVKCRPKSISLFLQQGVVKLFSDLRLNSNLQIGVAEHKSPSFLEHHRLERATVCFSFCKSREFQLPSLWWMSKSLNLIQWAKEGVYELPASPTLILLWPPRGQQQTSF